MLASSKHHGSIAASSSRHHRFTVATLSTIAAGIVATTHRPAPSIAAHRRIIVAQHVRNATTITPGSITQQHELTLASTANPSLQTSSTSQHTFIHRIASSSHPMRLGSFRSAVRSDTEIATPLSLHTRGGRLTYYPSRLHRASDLHPAGQPSTIAASPHYHHISAEHTGS